MDERQANIREGEGLAESRLNTDFVDFLKKWGMHALLAVAIVFLAYRGWELLEQRRIARIDDAFRQLEQAGPASTANPRALLDLAEQFEGVRAVDILARLRAADSWMVAVRRGVHPGAVFNPDGTLQTTDDLLDDQARALFLDNAAREYTTVRRRCQGKADYVLHDINALYGLAAVEESRGDFDAATAHYEEIKRIAEQASLTPHPQIAQHRIDTMGDLAEIPVLYARADLPLLPWAEPPAPADDGAAEDDAAGDDNAGNEGAAEEGAADDGAADDAGGGDDAPPPDDPDGG